MRGEGLPTPVRKEFIRPSRNPPVKHTRPLRYLSFFLSPRSFSSHFLYARHCCGNRSLFECGSLLRFVSNMSMLKGTTGSHVASVSFKFIKFIYLKYFLKRVITFNITENASRTYKNSISHLRIFCTSENIFIGIFLN